MKVFFGRAAMTHAICRRFAGDGAKIIPDFGFWILNYSYICDGRADACTHIPIYNMNVIRQSPIANLATLAVIIAAAVLRAHFAPYPAEAYADVPVCLARVLGQWQAASPAVAAAVSAVVWFVAGWVIGLVVRVRELYFVRTTITIPVYGIAACGIFYAHDSLTASVASLMFAVAVRSYFDAFRDGYGFTPIFFGSLCLGALPLLYAPAVLLLPLLPLAAIIFKRSAREALVALTGLLLAPFTACYVCWGAGGEFAQPVMQTLDALQVESGYRFFGSISAGSALLSGTLLALVLGAAMFSRANVYSMNSRARYITLFNMCAFIFAAATAAMPSSTATAFGLMAVPTAMAVPAMLVQIRSGAANLICAGVLSLFILHLFVG